MRTEAFPLRTKEQHQLDVEAALASDTHSHGVKRPCAVTQRLNYFHVTTGYPPDVLHDLLEGIVPVEVALYLDVLIKKRLFSRERLLPLMIGTKVSKEKEAWQMLMTLKDGVELVMSPNHTYESISHLNSLICDHRHRFCTFFLNGS